MTRPVLRSDWSYANLHPLCYGEVLDGEEGIALLDLVVGPIAMPTPLTTTVGMVEEATLFAEALQFVFFVHN